MESAVNEHALVFSVRRDGGVRFFDAEPFVTDDDASGLAHVARFLREQPHRATRTTIRSGAPAPGLHDAFDAARLRLGGVYSIVFADPRDTTGLLDALLSDPRVTSANRPTVMRPISGGASAALAALQRPAEDLVAPDPRTHTDPRSAGGFDQAVFCTASDAPPITVLDFGDADHPAIRQRVSRRGPAGQGGDLAWHGAQVVSVLAGEASHDVPAGCCDARIDYHNVNALRNGSHLYSHERLLHALCNFLESESRVLNLSFSGVCDDPTIALLLDHANRRGKVVVAAMPSAGSEDGPFPCSHPAVVAVGGLKWPSRDPVNDPHREASAYISAAGTGLRVPGPIGAVVESGSSYAAPAVSAAVWLALTSVGALSPDDIRALLRQSAQPLNRRVTPDQASGWGALDAAGLARLVCGSLTER